MRAFFAVDLDDAVIDAVAARAERLRGRAALSRARWVGRDVMHVTLRFLGDVDESLVPALGEIALRVGARPAFEVRAASLIAFPDARRARVLAVELDDDGGLGELARQAEAGVVALGLAPETRPFRGHLTLARCKEPADVRAIVADGDLGAAGRAVSLTLYESVLGRAGPTYTIRARAMLTSA
jgi:2'-5' RNA ligase